MKVLAAIIVPPHLSVSGAALAGEALSASLASRCEITVANMMRGAAIENPAAAGAIRYIAVDTWLPRGIPWSKLANRYSTLFYRSDLPAIIRRENSDLVHLHNPMPALELERAAGACWDCGIPYVISTHGFNEVANGIKIYRFGPLRGTVWRKLVLEPVRNVVQRAAAVFALSAADFDIVREMGFTGDLRIVGNGVSLPPAADPAADRAILTALGIPVEKAVGQITCMFLANHTPNKGLRVLFEAFASLDIPYLLIVGGEKRNDVDYARYVRTCRPGQAVVVTGRLTDPQVRALFRRADLFVFPTLADTFPLAVLEAMSYGLPVLASAVGGIPYQIDENCGVLVSAGDAFQLASAVQRLAQDPDRLSSMGRHARARVAANFTWEQAAEQAFAGYSDVLRRHGHAPS